MLDRNYKNDPKYIDAQSRVHFEENLFHNANDAFYALNHLPESADLSHSDVVDLGDGQYLMFTCGIQ